MAKTFRQITDEPIGKIRRRERTRDNRSSQRNAMREAFRAGDFSADIAWEN